MKASIFVEEVFCMEINKKKTFRVLQHVLFWIAFLFLSTSVSGSLNEKFSKTLLLTLTSIPTDILITYFHLYFIIPRYLLTRKFRQFFILFLITFIGVVLFERTYYVYVQYPLFYDNPLPDSFNFWRWSSLLYIGIYAYAVVFLAASIKLLKHWIQSQQQRNELEIRNKEGEIALLRMQVNPHFLFNSLNNIHSLINVNKDKASDALVMLSDIMRYMLYDTNTNRVPLENEIHYIQSFIELQKLRLFNPQIVNFITEGTIYGKFIAPMILIPFVENAFKHADKQNKFHKIQIKIIAERDALLFESSNAIAENHTGQINKSGGIGLQNVKRRLELIYPDKHELQINQKNDIFTVHLIIKEI
ncbi:MAG: histidine kinase [Bacteroidales bacterium]|jgi:sensor histidine kinase YesM|nr:histidine kinase [Bacteroidales bacterium]